MRPGTDGKQRKQTQIWQTEQSSLPREMRLWQNTYKSIWNGEQGKMQMIGMHHGRRKDSTWLLQGNNGHKFGRWNKALCREKWGCDRTYKSDGRDETGNRWKTKKTDKIWQTEQSSLPREMRLWQNMQIYLENGGQGKALQMIGMHHWTKEGMRNQSCVLRFIHNRVKKFNSRKMNAPFCRIVVQLL